MTIQRRFAPIGGRFDPESLAGLTGIYNFGKTHVAMQQKELFASLRRTPNFALRLGKTIWRNNSWILL